MQYTDNQLTQPDVNASDDFTSWDSLVLAIVLVLVNWVLVVLWLSMPPAQVKPIDRPLHVDAQRVAEGG